jgi:hypothetical protein
VRAKGDARDEELVKLGTESAERGREPLVPLPEVAVEVAVAFAVALALGMNPADLMDGKVAVEEVAKEATIGSGRCRRVHAAAVASESTPMRAAGAKKSRPDPRKSGAATCAAYWSGEAGETAAGLARARSRGSGSPKGSAGQASWRAMHNTVWMDCSDAQPGLVLARGKPAARRTWKAALTRAARALASETCLHMTGGPRSRKGEDVDVEVREPA